MLHILEHAFWHAIEDSVNLLPFLFITYLIMEYIEHKTNNRAVTILKESRGGGPVLGGIIGILPQCGMSAVASNFYAGGMITIGTLLAVFLSTSDEMLPIMLSRSVEAGKIAGIIGLKAGLAIIFGLLTDFMIGRFFKQKQKQLKIHEMCEHEHCHCEKGILRSTLRHTIGIFIFVIIITFLINLAIEGIGEENLAGFILNSAVFGPILAGLIGLIPNCAASVVITQMYLDGLMTFGTMMAGLLAGAGVGTIVLLKVNGNRKESFMIIGLLYGIGIITGIILNLLL